MDRLLLARARAWLADDPDPATRAELTRLLDADDGTAVTERFAARLVFGTAGLRGVMRSGPNGMNRAVVSRAAAGLGAYLAAPGTVVVGYDARHNSAAFATDTAQVLAGAGHRVVLLPRPLPTPVLAFAVRHLDATAGVMVTASHNPPADNGYKVYLGGPDGGGQIVPPADAGIEAAIAAVETVAGLARSDTFEIAGEDLVEAYVTAVAALPPTPERDVRVAYTPLHGVGAAVLTRAFARAGLPAPEIEPSQAEPDPDFPTVAFPNPEEPGAMDRVLALDADLVLANDPDADRLAVAVGGRMLTGDEVGVLFASYLLEHARGPVATTIVSSSWLGAVADTADVPYRETLTGFKWIVRAAPDLLFGYEEALGYAVAPGLVRDKDGISAAVLMASLAAFEKARGRSILDRLDDLARAHGVHATGQVSLRVDDLRRITDLMERLRAAPPDTLAGRTVERVDDLLAPPPDGPPPTDGLRLTLTGNARVVIRPSGTEPKLKAYLEVIVPADDLAAARSQAERDLAALHAAVTGLLH